MRALVFALGLALAAASAHAETIIAAADAPKHVGETVTVEGTVSAVHTELPFRRNIHRHGRPLPGPGFYRCHLQS